MTDEELAIEELTNMVTGEEMPQEEIKEEAPPAEKEVAPTPEPETAKEPDVKIDVAKIISEQAKQIADLQKNMQEKEEAKKEEQMSEEDMAEQQMIQEAQQKIGIDAQKQQELYAMLEQRKEEAAFDVMVNDFQKAHPSVDMKEMGEWAKENNLMQMLDSKDVNQWNVVANAMESIAKVAAQPDNITPTAQQNSGGSVWEKMDKGEEVSQEELGMDLLRGVGGWK